MGNTKLSRVEIENLVDIARKRFCKYGPNYRRNIHQAVADIDQSILLGYEHSHPTVQGQAVTLGLRLTSESLYQ